MEVLQFGGGGGGEKQEQEEMTWHLQFIYALCRWEKELLARVDHELLRFSIADRYD